MSLAVPPEVSVIVPVYHCERYIEQAIRSVQAQSWQDFDVVIVGDGSRDGTLRLARDLSSRA